MGELHSQSMDDSAKLRSSAHLAQQRAQLAVDSNAVLLVATRLIVAELSQLHSDTPASSDSDQQRQLRSSVDELSRQLNVILSASAAEKTISALVAGVKQLLSSLLPLRTLILDLRSQVAAAEQMALEEEQQLKTLMTPHVPALQATVPQLLHTLVSDHERVKRSLEDSARNLQSTSSALEALQREHDDQLSRANQETEEHAAMLQQVNAQLASAHQALSLQVLLVLDALIICLSLSQDSSLRDSHQQGMSEITVLRDQLKLLQAQVIALLGYEEFSFRVVACV